MKIINVTKSSIAPLDEYIEEIKDIWDSCWLTNMGVKHQLLEKKLSERLDCPNITLYTNGHLALEGIIQAMNFPKGSEIITTPFTFASTTHAISRNGLVPIFCDIDKDSYCIDPCKIEKLITSRTVAIIPVHVYGNICDVESIEKIASKYNLKVIYDGAHSFGEKYKGISTANFGDATMFSFHATKVFNTIEGGAVCFKRKEYKQILNDLKNFGIHGPEEVDFIGGNAKMNEFQAAMGLCNLRHLDDEISKRKVCFEEYKKLLCSIDGIKLPYIQDFVESNYAYFPVLFYNYKYNRDDIYERLKKYNVISRKYFYPLTSEFKCYSEYYTETPVAKFISENILCLPMYSDLSIEDIKLICEIIKGNLV